MSRHDDIFMPGLLGNGRLDRMGAPLGRNPMHAFKTDSEGGSK